MPTPFESGLLNLQLFDLRREPVLREARRWMEEVVMAGPAAEAKVQRIVDAVRAAAKARREAAPTEGN